jgi:hypothetical protein
MLRTAEVQSSTKSKVVVVVAKFVEQQMICGNVEVAERREGFQEKNLVEARLAGFWGEPFADIPAEPNCK